MNEVLQTMQTRSSIRDYTDEKLTKEELETLLYAGLQAPTATNRKEIHITVVDGADPILAEIEAEKNAQRNITNPEQNFYYAAPTVLLLSAEKAFKWSQVDAGIAVENIALAAESLSLGSLIIGCIKDALHGPKASYFAEKLQFPEGYEFVIAIALGHKAVSKTPHSFDFEKQVSFL